MTNPTPSPTGETGGTLGPSLVRTGVPFIAGLIGTWLLERFGVEVDTATVGALLTAGIGYLYYVVVRFLEVYGSSKWGYILGLRKQPVYAPPESTVVADVAGRHERPSDLGAASLSTAGSVLLICAVILLIIAIVSDAPFVVAVAAALIVVGIALMVLPRRTR